MPQAVLLLTATDEQNGYDARCCLEPDRNIAPVGRTIFDDLRNSVNSIRTAVDNKEISFCEPGSRQESYQPINQMRPRSPKQRSDVESFIAGKTYMLAFLIPEIPGEVFATDPWDAVYLGVSKKEPSQSLYLLRARGLVDVDASHMYARPSDKLVIDLFKLVQVNEYESKVKALFQRGSQVGREVVLLGKARQFENLLWSDDRAGAQRLWPAGFASRFIVRFS